MKIATPINITRSLVCAALVPAACFVLANCTTNHGYSRGFRGDEDRTPQTTVARAAAPEPKAAPRAEPVRGSCTPVVGADKNLTMLAFPTGNPATSALQISQVMPKQVRANASYPYEIHVCNLTNSSLENVMVFDQSSENLTIIDSDPKASKGSDGRVGWSVGDLSAGETRVIKVNARSASPGAASNCLTATYASYLCGLTQVVDPKLEIVKSAPAEVTVCDNIPISFTVKNAGTGTLENVMINDVLAAGLASLDNKTTLDLPVGTLATGESKTVSATVKASKTGRYENMATASSGDVKATSNKTSTVVKQAKLEIKCEPENTEYLGGVLTTKYTIRNTGDAACTDAKVTAVVPGGTSFVSATNGGTAAGNSVTWNIGALAAGATTSVSIDTRASTIGPVKHEATVSCTCAEPASTNCPSEVKGVPAVLLEVVDLTDPVELGNSTTYVITVTNQGSAPDTNITMSVELPANFEFVSASGATAASKTGNQTTFTPFATLAPGAKIEWRVVAKAKTAGNIRSKFSMTTDNTKAQGAVTETESTTLYE